MVCGQNRSSLRGDGGLAQMPVVDTEESLLHQGLLVTMEMRREERREEGGVGCLYCVKMWERG